VADTLDEAKAAFRAAASDNRPRTANIFIPGAAPT
jgi:hypothetical protein